MYYNQFNPGYTCYQTPFVGNRGGCGYALILVLFILLVIIGASKF